MRSPVHLWLCYAWDVQAYLYEQARHRLTNTEHGTAVLGQYPPGQYPPGQKKTGQNPPVPISPRTISLAKYVLLEKIFLNSSVLNYPKTCVSKTNLF